MKCEHKDHVGNRSTGLGNGTWYCDPDTMKWQCPACNRREKRKTRYQKERFKYLKTLEL